MNISIQFEYYKPIELLSKEHNITLSTNNNEEEGVQRTFEINKKIQPEYGKDLTLIYLKSDLCLLADIFEKFIIISLDEHESIPSFYVSLPVFT